MPYSGNPTVKRFKTDMMTVTKYLKGSLEEAYSRQADELMENMRGAVPVLTGRLRDSIRKKNVTRHDQASYRVSFLVMAGGPMTTVRYGGRASYARDVQIGSSGGTKGIARGGSGGVTYDYALGIEFGTVDMDAEPFFYSTARRYVQAGRLMAANTVENAVKENNKLRELRAEHYSNTGLGIRRGGRGGATFL